MLAMPEIAKPLISGLYSTDQGTFLESVARYVLEGPAWVVCSGIGLVALVVGRRSVTRETAFAYN